jgi:tetratricopeptide (TPR) repeat protein
VDGQPDSLFTLLDRVAARLVVAMPGRDDAPLSRSAALSTRSLPALRAYLAGEEALRAGRYASAVDAFQRAVAQDSGFALAYYRLSSAATWTGPYAVTAAAAAGAVRLAGRLDRLDSLRVVSWSRYLHGDPERALSGFRAIVRDRPDDFDAWFQLGETEYHWMPSLGYSANASREAFEHVLALEPENTGALLHLVRIAAREGNRSELDSLTTRLLLLEPDGPRAFEVRVLRVFAGSDAAEQSAMIASVDHAAAGQLQTAAASLVASGLDPEGAAGVARVLAEVGRRPVQRQFGELLMAQSLTVAGRLDAAAAALARLRRLSPQLAAEVRAALALAPLADPQPAELAEARTERAQVPEVESGAILPISIFPRQPAPPVRLYLLAMLSQRIGDETGARAYAGRLEQWRGGPTEAAFAREYLALIRASVLRSEGRPADALRALGAAGIGPDSILPERMRHPSAHQHWLRAELNRELGNDAEALRWYAAVPDPTGYDIPYLPGSELRRAEIHDRRGERAEAIRHYQRFIDLWRHADARLQPEVERARARLAKLDAAAAGDPG